MPREKISRRKAARNDMQGNLGASSRPLCLNNREPHPTPLPDFGEGLGEGSKRPFVSVVFRKIPTQQCRDVFLGYNRPAFRGAEKRESRSA